MAVAIAVLTCAVRSAWTPQVRDPDEGVRAVASMRRVDVNAAGVDEIALLPGIGRAIAGRIVRDRTERGPFASVDELRRVKGIGASTVERVRPFATAGQAT
jgi:competence ComEA-like helix-hairpin-helix protein